MTRNVLAASILAASLFTSGPALASTMPKADFGGSPTLGLGVGYGVGVSIDAPISPLLSIGIAGHFNRFSQVYGDARLLYKLVHGGGGLTLDLLAGAGYGGGIDPFIGVALAYPFTNRLTGRLNVGINPLAYTSYSASGLELGYKFSNTLEGTIGVNGLNDVLGLKLYI